MARRTSKGAGKTASVRSLPTKSAQIRALAEQGMSRGDIVRWFKSELGTEIRYQHVRNVLITPVKTPRA